MSNQNTVIEKVVDIAMKSSIFKGLNPSDSGVARLMVQSNLEGQFLAMSFDEREIVEGFSDEDISEFAQMFIRAWEQNVKMGRRTL